MPLQNKNIFLAGSTGLAGASILTHLLSNYPKTNIRASHFHTDPFIHHQNVEYVRGDLTSRSACRQMVSGCDIAIMAAAVTGGAQTAASSPWDQVSDNITMDVQLFHALYLERVPRVVFISTASVYQDFDGAIKENELDMNRDPHPAYFGVGWAKRCVEKLCRFWYEKAGLEVIIARSSNIYGPFAKFNPEVSHFVPALIRKAVEKRDPFEVWGSPAVARDIVYGEDFARAVVLMAAEDSLKFDVFNVGSGVKTTVGDTVNWTLKFAQHDPESIQYQEDQPTTIPFRLLDCSRIKEKLGWEPYYTPEAGVRMTMEWWVHNKDWWKR
jgi:nucleoside-diphosphate-sugar epimerase